MRNLARRIFDVPPGSAQCPKCPTIGFRLGLPSEEGDEMKEDMGVVGVFGAMMATSMKAVDAMYMRKRPLADTRICSVPIPDAISVTKFELTDDDKDTLWRCGYQAAKRFLTTFDWSQYLTMRNFSQE